MLALEVLGARALEANDVAMLGVCAEAWERGGWWIAWFCDSHEMVARSRHRKNRAKLRHQAEALLATILLLPLDEREWQHLKWADQDEVWSRRAEPYPHKDTT